MKRPWFSRRWVVQEIALATKATVHCGFEYVDWRDFADAVALLDSVQTAGRRLSDAAKKQPFEDYVARSFEEVSKLEAVKLVDATHSLFRSSPSTREPLATLENLVCRLSSFEVSEPRDAVFSLLAIAKDAKPEQGDIKPKDVDAEVWEIIKRHKAMFRSRRSEDYIVTYEAPVLEVYARMVEFIVRKADKTRALDIICRPWATTFSAANDHPISQVPGSDADNRQDPSRRKATSTSSGSQTPTKLPSWIVSVNEAPFNKVREVTHVDGHKHQTWTVKRENADGLIGYPDDHVRNYSAAGTRTLNLDLFRLRKRPGHYSMLVEGFVLDTLKDIDAVSQVGNIPGDWLKYAKWEVREHETNEPPDHRAWETFWRTLVADRDRDGRNAPPFFDRACKMVMRSEPRDTTIDTNVLKNHGFGKDRIQTKAARLGLAPKDARTGDFVCILYGCSVPVVLRRHLNEHAKDDEAHDEKERIKKVAKAFKNAVERRKSKLAQRRAANITRGNGSADIAGTTHKDKFLPNSLLNLVTFFALVYPGNAGNRNPAWVTIMGLLAMAIQVRRGAPLAKQKPRSQLVAQRRSYKLGERVVSGAVVSFASLILYHVCDQDLSATAACILLGAIYLYPQKMGQMWRKIVLRKSDASDKAVKDGAKYWYELIGEAYIHNMMNGEAIKWQNEQKTKQTLIFEIR
nr:hypothetical protein B0A51_01734 [Rachicladosporium sp. CCFEE 5018]